MSDRIKNRYNRIARFYDTLEYPMERMFAKWRDKLLKEARGRVLEVGIGTGRTIPLYPDGTDLTGIDFSEKMIRQATKKAANKKNVQLKVMDAENMEFDDNSFDTVVTNCVFCSVPDAIQGLKEIRRVCKPGGKVLMLEHVRSRKPVAGKIMDLVNFIPLNLYGANINRRTYSNLLEAGFQPKDIEQEFIWSDIVLIFRIINNKTRDNVNQSVT